MTPRRTLLLNEGWMFRETDDSGSEYLQTHGFPTEIHLDLMHHGLIPNPLRGKHENDVQWVGERSWTYRKSFSSPERTDGDEAVLVFEGLDTYATVRLNGIEILKTEDMFIPERINVTDRLLLHCHNVLEITFESAWFKGKNIVDQYPQHLWECWNGDPSRLAVRKAQYHYGWDWGPCLLTCGPWRPIYIELYRSCLTDVYFTTDVSESLESAEVAAMANVDGEADQVRFQVSINGFIVGKETVIIRKGFAQALFTAKSPKLWFPRKYGNQPLYLLEVTLLFEGQVLDTVSKRFGLRRARVVQKPLANALGASFMVEINNISIFCGGSNWIPADCFLTRLTTKKYHEWVRMVADGNQVMLRVWGGGIYEQDTFYQACDEIGILVWQDFMFACGNYPAHSEFLNLVKREAIANVKRLRHHPSIVLWAGNNEDYQYAESEGLGYDPNDKEPESWLRSTFPARYIYEKILQDVTSTLVPATYYHFGSPYGGRSTTDPTIGDIHQWNIWHGTQEKYQDADRLSGRFVSEFGMQAFPAMKTASQFFLANDTDPDMYAASSTVSFHNKAAGHDRRLAIYLSENIRFRFEPFEYYIYCTQLMQSECVGTAYRLWKRQWQGPGKQYCAGALVWQTNDCWPCTSWSVIDYELRPKLTYYAIKREMESVTVGMKRTITKIPADNHSRADVKTVYSIQLWVCNFDLVPHCLGIAISTANVEIGVTINHQGLFRTPELPPNRSTEVMEFEIPVARKHIGEEEQTIVCATLVGPHNIVMKRVLNWPEPLKFVHLPKPSYIGARLGQPLDDDIKEGPDCVRMLSLMSSSPLKGVSVEVEGEDNQRAALLSDNGFDIMAAGPHASGIWHSLKVTGLKKARSIALRIRYLGCEKDYVTDVMIVDSKDEGIMGKGSMADRLLGSKHETLY